MMLGIGRAVRAAIFAGLLGYGAGYLRGESVGAADELAKHNATTVQQLGAVLKSHANLVAEANSASGAMRKAVADRAAQDTKSTRELKDALAKRSGPVCVLDARIVRDLTAARDRAAEAAARGILDTVPAAAGPAGEPRRDADR